jgi:branched-chain amino acid transport system permease protein
LLRIQPDAAFSVNYSALMIFTVVIGGVGTIEGPIIGTIIFFTLQQTLSQYGSWYLILLGAIAALTTVWAKRGLWGFIKKRWGLELFPVRRRVWIEEGVSPLEQAALERAEAAPPEADTPAA